MATLFTSSPRYSFDTNVLIEAWRERYPPTVFPKLWELMDSLITQGLIEASEEVLEELKKREGDDLTKWAMARPAFFFPHTDEVQQAVKGVLRAYPKLLKRGKSGGDPWVIALAQVHQSAVVTQEAVDNGNANKPNIPHVCTALSIRCINFVEFLREQGWSF
jgi:hypothetical protein